MKPDEYHLMIAAPHRAEEVLQTHLSSAPFPRISRGDRVENLLEDRSAVPEGSHLIAFRVHHSLHHLADKTYFTTRIETRLISWRPDTEPLDYEKIVREAEERGIMGGISYLGRDE